MPIELDQEYLKRLTAARETFNASKEYAEYLDDEAKLLEIMAAGKRSQASALRGELNAFQAQIPIPVTAQAIS